MFRGHHTHVILFGLAGFVATDNQRLLHSLHRRELPYAPALITVEDLPISSVC